mmetsp:Transcript_61476/g.194587  ORF Transcript_61476/g.194587 Transcript_61476/m.194587 type:complete len:213 (+) Transcript_61476:1491-2129(+)
MVNEPHTRVLPRPHPQAGYGVRGHRPPEPLGHRGSRGNILGMPELPDNNEPALGPRDEIRDFRGHRPPRGRLQRRRHRLGAAKRRGRHLPPVQAVKERDLPPFWKGPRHWRERFTKLHVNVNRPRHPPNPRGPAYSLVHRGQQRARGHLGGRGGVVESPARISPENLHLIDRLVAPVVSELGGPVRREDEQRDFGLRGLDHRGEEVCYGRAG